MWHDWFRKRIAENMPYDEIVQRRPVRHQPRRPDARGLAQARPRRSTKPSAKGFDDHLRRARHLDLFWRRQQPVPIDQWGEKTAAAFLGVRLECAQCHKHPFDRWTQADYRAFANIFAVVNFGISPEAKKADRRRERRARKKAARQERKPGPRCIREMFVGTSGRHASLLHASRHATSRCRPRRWAVRRSTSKQARIRASRCSSGCAAPDNPFFARSFVNRVWGHYFGVGIVHPVDDFSLANPPSNDKLLDALAKDFVDNKFDIRQLERTILQFAHLPADSAAQRHQPAGPATTTRTATSGR